MWTDWTYSERRPIPEKPSTRIHVQFADGTDDTGYEPETVAYWYNHFKPKMGEYQIKSYKVVK